VLLRRYKGVKNGGDLRIGRYHGGEDPAGSVIVFEAPSELTGDRHFWPGEGGTELGKAVGGHTGLHGPQSNGGWLRTS